MIYPPTKSPPPPPYEDHSYVPGPSRPYAFASTSASRHSSPPAYKPSHAADRFKPPKRIQDPVFLIFFIISFLSYVVLSGVVISQWMSGQASEAHEAKDHRSDVVALNGDTAVLLLSVTGVALLVSSVQFMMTRAFPRVIMHITFILSILMNVALCILFWLMLDVVAACVFTLAAIISVISYFAFLRRIPLACLFLRVVMDISNAHLGVYSVAFTALFLQGALSIWYILLAFATAKAIGLIIFETFAFLWSSQVTSNVALATLAGGPFGAWYYGPRESGKMSNHPTLSAFGRAASFNLGSIAFGSLIVAVLDMIRLALDMARGNGNAMNLPILSCLSCCAQCFFGCIISVFEYFNRYAYIEIALYGDSYIESARSMYRLFKDRGVDTMINDNLVSMILVWGAYLVGLATALVTWTYLRSMTLGSAIEAGVSTIFVGLAEDPQLLRERSPQLFDMISEHYPDVLFDVPSQ